MKTIFSIIVFVLSCFFFLFSFSTLSAQFVWDQRYNHVNLDDIGYAITVDNQGYI